MEDTAQDFGPIYARLADGDSLPAGAVLDTDQVHTRGSGEGWAPGGDT
jgi:phenylalanine-4-hydroxylase